MAYGTHIDTYHAALVSRSELERILGRASTLQLAYSDGQIRIGDLEQAAEEVGIAPSILRRAICEIETEPPPVPELHGMATRVVRRRWMDCQLDRGALERIATRLDAHFSAIGQRSLGEHSLSWFARHIHVSVETDRGGTLVQISERFVNTIRSNVAASVVIGTMFMLPVFLTVAGAGFIGPGFLLSTLMGITGILTAYSMVKRQHGKRLQQIGEEFDQVLSALARSFDRPRLLPAG